MNTQDLKLQKTSTDLVIEVVAVLGLIALILIPLVAYSSLPDSIPIHYGANGEADGWGSKISIFFLPILGICLYGLFKWLSRYPHKFNYPYSITEENRERSYSMALRMMTILNALVMGSFAYITYTSIRTAAGEASGLGKAFIPIFIMLNVGVSGYYLYQSYAKGKEG